MRKNDWHPSSWRLLNITVFSLGSFRVLDHSDIWWFKTKAKGNKISLMLKNQKTLHFVNRNESFLTGVLSCHSPIGMSGVSLLTVETGQTYSMKWTERNQSTDNISHAKKPLWSWTYQNLSFSFTLRYYPARNATQYGVLRVPKDEVVEGKTNTSIDISGHGTFSYIYIYF